jgi:Protein of unknown function (DUF2934)
MTQASPRNVMQMSKNQSGHSDHEGVQEEIIRLRAYELYEERGRHDGHQLEDWIQAEQEIRDKFGLRKAA